MVHDDEGVLMLVCALLAPRSVKNEQLGAALSLSLSLSLSLASAA